MEQKTELPGFYKVDEGLIINKDNESLTAYKKNKLKEYKVNKLQAEISSLKNDVSEIKEMLKRIVK